MFCYSYHLQSQKHISVTQNVKSNMRRMQTEAIKSNKNMENGHRNHSLEHRYNNTIYYNCSSTQFYCARDIKYGKDGPIMNGK
jgi:hypothetical protein